MAGKLPHQLSPRQALIYRDHGQALATYPIRPIELARRLGVGEHDVKVARQWAITHGPPTAVAQVPAIHVVIGDCHVSPGQDLRRFRWLGLELERIGREAMAARCPLRVIQIGDWGDYHSLSTYDTGTSEAWGRTYPADVAAHLESARVLRSHVSAEVWQYADRHWCEGNHEERAGRYMRAHPEIQGVLMGAWEAMASEGWHCHELGEWVQLDGIGYCHYMQSPGSSRPVAGVNHARSLVLKGHRSVVVGHSHRLDSYTETDAYGDPVQALVCGMYAEHVERYAGQSNARWWRGYCVLRQVARGGYDLETVSLSTLEHRYADRP